MQGERQEKEMEHKSGYHVWIYGEKSWHRSLDRAIAKAEAARNYCQNLIEIQTSELKYGRPE